MRIILISIKKFVLEHDFLVAFWSSILSGLIVSLLIGFIVYQYTNIFKSPKLSFVVKQNGFYRDTILLSEGRQGNYEATFQFAIKNSGNQTINAGEGYWHLYIKTDSPTIFSAPGEQNHNRDLIQSQVYPGAYLDINFFYKLVVKKDDIGKAEIPYFFQTAYGNYPKTVKIDPKTGNVPWEDMDYIKFELPK